MAHIYAYVRVSSTDQNEARQIKALEKLGMPIDRIYIDKQSGQDFERTQYKKLMRKLQQGDLLIAESIDRLGRNYSEIISQWQNITVKKKADIKIIDMPLLDTTLSKDLLGTFISDLVLQILSFVAHQERESIRSRQAEGIAAAKARGVRFGRPELPLPDYFCEVCRQWNLSLISTGHAARLLDMPRSTFYRKAKKYSFAALLPAYISSSSVL